MLAGFAIIMVITGILAFTNTRDFFLNTSQLLDDDPGDQYRTPTPLPEGVFVPDEPFQGSTGPIAEPWDGASRVTILLMGLDYRDWTVGEGPPRTDSMMLLTLDPVGRTAGMLSIPRDLWVEIPGGFGYGKINTAYQLGEAYEMPGGGPGLAIDTVEKFLGVDIHFYAQIDFGAFERFIDEIGGVKINVTEEITIDRLGGDDIPLTLQPGVQTLPGDIALGYIRTRKTAGGDFDRSRRQQEVIMAIRNQILRFDMIPTLIEKSEALFTELSGGINTNLDMTQIIQLAILAQQIPEEDIHGVVIDVEHVTFAVSPEGLDIVKPIPDQIRILRDEIFGTATAAGATCSTDITQCVLTEGAIISVRNGTSVPGLASGTGDYLLGFGFNIIEVTNANQPYQNTTIIDYTGNPYTVQYLVELLSISPNAIFSSYDPSSTLDIVIALGLDWAYNNPLP